MEKRHDSKPEYGVVFLLRHHRAKKGVKLKDLAKKLGVSLSTIYNWENEITSPDSKMLRLISTFLQVSMDSFFCTKSDSKKK